MEATAPIEVRFKEVPHFTNVDKERRERRMDMIGLYSLSSSSSDLSCILKETVER